MKIIIEAEPRIDGKLCSGVPLQFEELGSEAYITMTIDGREYSLGYHEFWNAARSVCISAWAAGA